MEPNQTNCEVITLYNLDCNKKLALSQLFLYTLYKAFCGLHKPDLKNPDGFLSTFSKGHPASLVIRLPAIQMLLALSCRA